MKSTTPEEPSKPGAADPTPGPRQPSMPVAIPAEESGYPRPPLTPATVYQRTKAHWRSAALVTAIGLLAVAAVILTRTPIYRSETTIAYQGGIDPNLVGQEGSDALKTLAADLEARLLSRSNLAPIVDEFQLYPAEMARGGEVAASQEFTKHILFRKRTADTFAISFKSSTPEQAQAVTARLAGTLITTMQDEARRDADKAVEFLSSEMARARKELEDREKALSQFLAEHPERALEAPALGSTEPLDAGAREMALLERELQRQLLLLKQPKGSAAPGVDPKLVAEVAAAEQNLREKERIRDEEVARGRLPQHPDLQAAERQVQAAQGRLKSARDTLAAAQPGPALADEKRPEVEAQVQRLKAEIEKRKRQPTAPPGDLLEKIRAAELEHERLKRAQDAAGTSLHDLERKLATAELARKSTTSGVGPRLLVRDPAYRPSNSETMPRSRVGLIGLAISVLLGIGAAALRGVFLDPRIFRAADVRHLEVPVLAIVPKGTSKPDPR